MLLDAETRALGGGHQQKTWQRPTAAMPLWVVGPRCQVS
jgi:hypothetical protein